MDSQIPYTCPICGNTDIHSIGILNGKPYCRRCISFKGEEVENSPSYPKKAPIHIEYELSPEQKELSDKLVENLQAFVTTIVKSKPQTVKGQFIKNISVSSTMGPGVKVDISTLTN